MPAQPVTRYLHSIYTFILFFNECNFIYIIYHLVVQRQAGNMANLSLCFCAISPMFSNVSFLFNFAIGNWELYTEHILSVPFLPDSLFED